MFKTILNNTFWLVAKQIIQVLTSLASVGVLLRILGPELFGTLHVLLGVMLLTSFLQGSMASATQRFFSFSIGRNEVGKLGQIFNANIVGYIIVAVLTFALYESVGHWYLLNELLIPEKFRDYVIHSFHILVASTIFTVLTTPYIAIILAYEDMKVLSLLAIIESLAKLLATLPLLFFQGDHLVWYVYSLLVVSIVNWILHASICYKKYPTCRTFSLKISLDLYKDLFGFTLWTLYGQMSVLVRNQGVTILVNQFTDPVTVAARAIAMNIGNQTKLLSYNLNTVLYPQIIKAYASYDKRKVLLLLHTGSKSTYYGMLILFFPLYFHLDLILVFWLGSYPDQTVIFAQILLIEALINSLSLPIITLARAPGKMRLYELVLGTINLTILPISWYLFTLSYDVKYVLLVALCLEFVMLFVRLFIVQQLTNLSIREFIWHVLFRCAGVTSCALILTVFNEPTNSLYSFFEYVITIILIIGVFGFNSVELKYLSVKLRTIFERWKRKYGH